MNVIFRVACCAGMSLSITSGSILMGQEQIAEVSAPVLSDLPAARAVAAPASAPQPESPTWQVKADRWLSLNTFSYGSRYRSTFDINGARSFDQGQERLVADGKFKFDEQGRYGIGFHLSSGRYFNWSYSDFIGGGQHEFVANTTQRMSPFQQYIFSIEPPPTGFYNSGGGELYFRQLFLTAQPISGVEFQFGGFAINHGVNTEATSYDDDGYMSGERVSLRRPKQFWLSEVTYTRGYLGDIYDPNFFTRGTRLSISNYWQILGRKDFGKRVAVSADYTFSRPEGAAFFLKTTREGILADTHFTKAVDKVRFEAYQRINAGYYFQALGLAFKDGKGYALTLNRDFKKRADLDAGLVSVDPDYGNNLGLNPQAVILGLALNGDQYGVGKRYFVRPTIQLGHSVSLVGAYSKLYGPAPTGAAGKPDVWNARSLTAGVQFDIKKALFGESKSR